MFPIYNDDFCIGLYAIKKNYTGKPLLGHKYIRCHGEGIRLHKRTEKKKWQENNAEN